MPTDRSRIPVRDSLRRCVEGIGLRCENLCPFDSKASMPRLLSVTITDPCPAPGDADPVARNRREDRVSIDCFMAPADQDLLYAGRARYENLKRGGPVVAYSSPIQRPSALNSTRIRSPLLQEVRRARKASQSACLVRLRA